MIQLKINYVMIISALMLFSCSPSIKLLNGEKYSVNNSYFIFGDTNSISLKGLSSWDLDTSSLEGYTINRKHIQFYPPTSPKKSVSLNFSNKFRKFIKQKITIYYGEKPRPIFRYNPSLIGDTMRFENLRFLNVFVSSQPSYPHYKTYKVEKMYFSYNNKSFVTEKSNFSLTELDSIYSVQPNRLMIDSLTVEDYKTEVTQTIKVMQSFVIEYPESNDFECLDSDGKKVYLFEDLIAKGSDEITITRKTDFCDIIKFSRLGTASHVSIRDEHDNDVFNSFIYNGYRMIDNYFNFSDYSDLSVKITGDFMWDGVIKIR